MKAELTIEESQTWRGLRILDLSRPMMVCQRELYPGLSYFRLRPGITGYWQISDRNACNFGNRAQFDDRYEQEVSFETDLRVVSKTVSVVLRGTGY